MSSCIASEYIDRMERGARDLLAGLAALRATLSTLREPVPACPEYERAGGQHTPSLTDCDDCAGRT